MTSWFVASIAISIAFSRLAPQYTLLSSHLLTGLAIFLGLLSIRVIYGWIIYPHLLNPLRKLPSPPGGSFWNGQWRYVGEGYSGARARRWINEIPNDGLIAYRFLLNRYRVLATSPEALKEILVTKSYEFTKPPATKKGLGRIFGTGLLIAEGEEHKIQKKGLLPAFSFRHIRDLYPVFWDKSLRLNDALSQHLKDRASSTAVEPSEWSTLVALDIVGAAGLGQDFNSLADPNKASVKTYRAIFAPSRGATILNLLHAFFPSWLVNSLPLKRTDDINNAVQSLRKTSLELLRKKKRNLEEATEAKAEATKASASRYPPKGGSYDILSIALASGTMSEEVLVSQGMTFLIAGHETSGTALQWMIWRLCRHQAMQTRLREEIHRMIPPWMFERRSSDTDDATTTSPMSMMSTPLLDSLPYLNAFIHEVLRYNPPVPLTVRVSDHDTTILSHHIPKDTWIILSPWAINFSKSIWGPDYDQFNPDRWLETDNNDDDEEDANEKNATSQTQTRNSPSFPSSSSSSGTTNPYAFLTFLTGPRSCIGRHFAISELKALVAALVGKWQLDFEDPALQGLEGDETLAIGNVVNRPVWREKGVKLVPA